MEPPRKIQLIFRYLQENNKHIKIDVILPLKDDGD